MPLMRADPNYFSTQLSFSTTTTDDSTLIGLGFPATALRLLNTCNDDVYARLDGNVATTKDLRVRACSEVFWSPLPPFSFLGLYTTAATKLVLGVTALGG